MSWPVLMTPAPATLSPEFDLLAQRAQELWRRWQPSSASIMGSLVLDQAEDLSDEGLAGWLDELDALEKVVNALRPQAVTAVDVVLADELDRFVQEKKYQARIQQPFLSGLSPYLHLIMVGLLPFALSPPAPEATEEGLALRLQTAESWLALAAGRQEAGILVTTEAAARQAATSIISWPIWITEVAAPILTSYCSRLIRLCPG